MTIEQKNRIIFISSFGRIFTAAQSLRCVLPTLVKKWKTNQRTIPVKRINRVLCIIHAAMHKENTMSDKSNWLENIPEDIRSSIFLIFKVALLIFHFNHVTLSDYPKYLDDFIWVEKCLYAIEMIIHLVVKVSINVLLIWLICLNFGAIRKIRLANKDKVLKNASGNKD